MARDKRGFPEPVPVSIARVSAGKGHHNTLKLGYCFLYLTLMDDDMCTPLADTPYTIKGMKAGFSLSGKSDGEGVVRHERVPDDHYELTCEGATERVELLFNHHRARHEGRPWPLRMRGVERQG